MKKELRRPDFLFEVSWEVCNKVGGIHTVISTKAVTLVDELGSNFILIGPDVWRESSDHPEFMEDKKLYKAWRDKASEEGLHIKIGQWKIASEPTVILVDFATFISQKDNIFSSFWETYKLDSLSGHWDYIEPSLFGYAAAKVIESFTRFHLSIRDKVVAQFHEWMTGTGALYLKQNAPQIATVFTTHATVLGRSIAGNQQPLYGKLENYNPDTKAIEFNVMAKHSLERITAAEADAFTTVSEVTARECTHFLQKQVSIVTPNGFENSFVPQGPDFDIQRTEARSSLLTVSEALLGYKLPSDSLLVATSGRYEFKNKGIDLFIDSLGELNKSEKLNKTILAFVLIPANHYGPRPDLLTRLNGDTSHPLENRILTHNLHDAQWDPTLKRIAENKLYNNPSDKVKIIFVPSYLNGDDGIFNKSYYKLLIGFDATVFASYYEPWGYTPLESIAFHIPTITTSLSGFGQWVMGEPTHSDKSVVVIERTDTNDAEVVHAIVYAIAEFCNADASQVNHIRKSAYELSQKALWFNFIQYYRQAYSNALIKAQERAPLFSGLERAEVTQPYSRIVMANDPGWKKILIKKSISDKLQPLVELSRNLWWSWDYDAIELFRSIDPSLWDECGHNPIVLLENTQSNRILKLEKDEEFLSKLKSVHTRFKNYMNAPHNPDNPKVAYFSMEFGIHDSLKTYSGGLGILAGDYLKEASDNNYDMVGIGLLYRYGYFRQDLSHSGEQQANYDSQNFNQIPVEPVRDENGNRIEVRIVFPGRTISIRVWKAQVGRVPLYLLDTDFEQNTDSDRSITHKLYGGDWENRLKQELVLGVGGIRVLEAIGANADLYHCNEGHAAFIGIERLRHFIANRNLTFGESLELVRVSTLFTTHTPVPAGHDAFDESLIRMYIGHYPERLKISWTQFIALGKINPEDPNEKFSMSYLAANLSQEINGVSRLHGTVSQHIFAPLYRGYIPEELHIGYVTNGVHLPTWAAKPWIDLYKQTFGNDFIDHQIDKSMWNKIYDVPNEQIWNIRNTMRGKLIDYVKDYIRDTGVRRFENPKRIREMSEKLDPKALTIGFARRFATYKRAHLLFSDLPRLANIVNNPEKPVQFLFAGKAHPHDKAGQDLIKMIVEISSRPEFAGKIVFLPNYEIHLAKQLLRGVDIWLNTPTRPLEASGTSGEKAVMNGVLHFSVLDGWWAEGYQKDAGWALSEQSTYSNNALQDQLDAETIYNLIENEVIPSFYNRDVNNVPDQWVGFIKNSIAKVASNFTMARQLDDYHNKYYARMFERSKRIYSQDFELAKEISTWKKRVARAWESIEVLDVGMADINKQEFYLGESLSGHVVLDLNELAPSDIGVELVVSEIDDKTGDRKLLFKQDYILEKVEGQKAYYSIILAPHYSGEFEFGVRVFPKHRDLPHRQDFNYALWI